MIQVPPEQVGEVWAQLAIEQEINTNDLSNDDIQAIRENVEACFRLSGKQIEQVNDDDYCKLFRQGVSKILSKNAASCFLCNETNNVKHFRENYYLCPKCTEKQMIPCSLCGRPSKTENLPHIKINEVTCQRCEDIAAAAKPNQKV